MKSRRATAIVACVLAVAALLVAELANARASRPVFRMHVEPGAQFNGGRDFASFGGPRREGTRCIVDVTANASLATGGVLHHVPTSTLGDGCNGVAVTVFPRAFVLRDDAGTTTTYSLSSGEPIAGPITAVPRSLEWIAIAGVLFAVAGAITRARAAIAAAVLCTAPLAVALASKLLSD